MLNLLITAVLLASIAYMIACALVEKDGPWDILAKIRFKAGINVPVFENNVVATGAAASAYVEVKETGEFEANGTWLAGIFDCQYCMTPYVAAVLVTAFYFLFSLTLAQTAVVYLAAWGQVWWMLDLAD